MSADENSPLTNVRRKTARSGGRAIAICAVLAALVFAVYGQTRGFGFISFDDDTYITANPRVKNGLSAEGFAWSFSFEAKDKTYWHPLTWLSHMLDVELFGLNPAGHHLMNVALHALSAVLLFLALARLTGAPWLSGLVAALFAVHPLNIESVAWVAERKNVLSTTFWMLALLAYAGYVRKPGMLRYGILITVFTLGLLAKPMLVTLPFVLLLIDFWPLGRLGRVPGVPRASAARHPPIDNPRRPRVFELIIEKVPLLVLSLLVAYLANESMSRGDTVVPFERIPPAFRLLNGLLSYAAYAAKVVWPADLAVFYPYPQSISLLEAGLAALVLAGISVCALWNAGRRPYLLFGWAWFVGTLTPVSGIIQVGLWPAWADRWAYIPSIGLFIAIVWGVNDAVAGWRRGAARAAVAAAAVSVVLLLAAAAHRQAAVWAGDLPLFQDALAKTEDNFLAHYNIGSALYRVNRVDEAMHHFHEAARINPEHCLAYYTHTLQLLLKKQPGDAARYYQKALSLKPRTEPGPRQGLHTVCRSGGFLGALSGCRVTLGTGPAEKTIHNGIGAILFQLGRVEEAIASFRDALRIDPDYVDALNNIGFASQAAGRIEESIRYLEKALVIEPGNLTAQKNLTDLHELASTRTSGK